VIWHGKFHSFPDGIALRWHFKQKCTRSNISSKIAGRFTSPCGSTVTSCFFKAAFDFEATVVDCVVLVYFWPQFQSANFDIFVKFGSLKFYLNLAYLQPREKKLQES